MYVGFTDIGLLNIFALIWWYEKKYFKQYNINLWVFFSNRCCNNNDKVTRNYKTLGTLHNFCTVLHIILWFMCQTVVLLVIQRSATAGCTNKCNNKWSCKVLIICCTFICIIPSNTCSFFGLLLLKWSATKWELLLQMAFVNAY